MDTCIGSVIAQGAAHVQMLSTILAKSLDDDVMLAEAHSKSACIQHKEASMVVFKKLAKLTKEVGDILASAGWWWSWWG